MIIGCPKEIKAFENRVALIPSTVKELTDNGSKVLVEKNAGIGVNFTDQDYQNAGAEIVADAKDLWSRSDLITKVKEPLEQEFVYFRADQIIFTYLHLAAEPALTSALLEKKVTSIAYETIEKNGALPLLKPMSEVAGRMAVQDGARCLENQNGGKGILLSGVPGVRKGRVAIIGGGVVGKNAAKIALGMGARVSILDINPQTLENIDDLFLGQVQTIFSNEDTIKSQVTRADLVIGAVLVTGARAPRLVTRDMIKGMEKGSVVVDVAVDQGGCIETVRRTSHDNPSYIEEGIVHYGVANMPGAVAMTSTFALSQVTFPYLKTMAKNGVLASAKADPSLLKGINTLKGAITHESVARAFDRDYVSALTLI